MKLNKVLAISLLLLISSQTFAQPINERLSIISECDTSSIHTHIGEIYYFGRNMEKAKDFPQLICHIDTKRFKLLWVSSKRYKKRARITDQQLNEYVFEMKNNGFEKYPCYAFTIIEKVEDWGDAKLYSLDFPSIVEVYKYQNKLWVKLFDKMIESSKDWGELQLNVIKKY